MRSRLCFLWLVFAAITPVAAQPVDSDVRFQDREFTDDAGPHKYRIFLPDSYDEQREWPVILYLHGAGERGRDGVLPSGVGLGSVIGNRPDFPYIVVFPQCEETDGRILTAWDADGADGKRAIAMLDEVIKEYSIDRKRQILTGWSMGGYGCWLLGIAQPDRWQAIVPLSGGLPEKAMKLEPLRRMPVWVFHGATDQIVRINESREAVNAFRVVGGQPRFSEFKNLGHDIWKDVYGGKELWEWLENPTAQEANLVSLARPGQRPPLGAAESDAFVPGLDIENAVFLRMGNDMLETLAHSVPSRIPAESLNGRLDDMFDSTNVDGRSFRLQFRGITYSAQVTRAFAKAYAPGRLNIQLGIENARMDIRSTSVTGRSHSAVAGAIRIGIGHRGPVWLSIAVEPYIENRQLRLKLIATRFDIPRNNWYVTAPAGVSTQGFGMTREKVSRGLVSGLYGSKRRIQNEVQAIVPELISQLEKNLDLAEVGSTATLFWPLPVYRPRLRIWPQNVVTDETGMSLVFGVTAASVNPAASALDRQTASAGNLQAEALDRSSSLEVGISSQSLNPLTKLLIDADVARVHVEDIPDGTFSPFTDPAVLRQIFPEHFPDGPDIEVWSELVLVDPLEVIRLAEAGDHMGEDEQGLEGEVSVEADVEASNGSGEHEDGGQKGAQMDFHVPSLVISVATRKRGTKQWTPFADLEFDVRQHARIEVARPEFETRLMRLGWVGDPRVDSKIRLMDEAAVRNPDSLSALTALFTNCWKDWTGTGPARETVVGDIDFGKSVMRLEELGWNGEALFTRFQPPGIRISNLSDQTLVYEVRSESSPWGGPYRIDPGESDDFNVGYGLIFRRADGTQNSPLMLSVGNQFEFRPSATDGSLGLFRSRSGTDGDDGSTDQQKTPESVN